MRQIEFLADEEGDWAFHCHKSHHTMNAMGHDVPTLIGVDHRKVVKDITNVIPDYMVMGERGMADMAEMDMPLPDNTAKMMTGDGPFGSVEMGGMFSMVKVRKDQKPGDYKDPGWFTHPKAKHPLIDEVNRDFCFLLNAYDIDPGSKTPKIMTMLDFNIWSWNSRVFPGIDPLVVRKNDKVRIRMGNLTMTNHPIHLHGHEFLVTGTDGGPTPKSTRW